MAAGYSNSVWLGNAGEHLVVGKLLSLHFHAFVADRNNRAFDVAAYRNGKFSLLRVKTKTAGSAVWTRKKDGTTFLERRSKRDFVVIVDLAKGLEKARFFVVPTSVVQRAIDVARKEWTSGPKRDGGARVDSTAQRLWLDDKVHGPAWRGWGAKWRRYIDNWGQLSK